jgi:uncharacterized protein (TIGR02300 family)
MAKEEWGVKRLCPTTGKRFYDMNKNPIISPYTGEPVEIETGKRSTIAADAEDAQTKKAKESKGGSDADLLDDNDVEVELEDDILDDEEDDNVSLDDLKEVAAEDGDET